MTTIITLEDRILFTHEWNPGAIVAQNCESHIFGHTSPPAFGNTNSVYVNNEPIPVRLVAANLWMGIGYNTFADLIMKVVRFSDGMLIAEYHQDKYSNSGDNAIMQNNFRPEGFELAPGDRLVVYCLNCHVSGDDSPMHPIIFFYFSKPVA